MKKCPLFTVSFKRLFGGTLSTSLVTQLAALVVVTAAGAGVSRRRQDGAAPAEGKV